MDKIYVGQNIPLDYTYAIWGSNYVDLFNSPTLEYGYTYHYYRLYFYENTFLYTEGDREGSRYTTSTTLVETTDDFLYRRDIDSIFAMSFFVLFGVVLCINIITSVIKKGGMLSGLL